jgi:NADP-dependent 3-hydroxy acid dehydrogenase YdfG
LHAAENGSRQVADVVNISSVACRVAGDGSSVYNLTKFGVNGLTESLRQEVTRRHVRVGVIEPGAVVTELTSHNSAQIQANMFERFNERTERLGADDIAYGNTYMVTRPATPPSASCGSCPPSRCRRRPNSTTGKGWSPCGSSSSMPPATSVVA